MRLSLLALVLLFCTSCTWSSKERPSPAAYKLGVQRVLFIGNSLTYTNDLPKVLQEYVAQAYPGVRLETKAVTGPGWTLDQHKSDGKALRAIQAHSWNYVVVQGGRGDTPGGTMNGRRFFLRPTKFLQAVDYFTDEVKKQGGTPILFGGWGSRNSRLSRYRDQAYTIAAEQSNSISAPVAEVSASLRLRPTIRLIGPDGIHPTKQGTVLAAMVLARVMFGDPVEPSEIAKAQFSAQDLALIRTVLDHRENDDAAAGPLARLHYGPPPKLQADEPLDLPSSGRWCGKDSGFRYSAGAMLVTGNDRSLRLVNFMPGARLSLPISNLKRGNDRINFDTTTGGQDYHVTLVRHHGGLRLRTSYRSNATHQTLRTTDYGENCRSGYFDKMTRLYDRLETQEKHLGLSRALREHYQRLKAFLGPEGMKRATSGFGLDEWDAIMVSWVYEALGKHVLQRQYLAAATELYLDSLDAKLYRADALADLGDQAGARKLLQAALKLDAARKERVRENLENKLRELDQ